jgi:hypothetical protein
MKYERLIARIPAPRSKLGVSTNDIERIVAVPELTQEVEDCLRSEDESDLIFGLYFAERLRLRADFCSIASSKLPEIAGLVRLKLGHASERVRAGATRAFVAFRSHYPDYIAAMGQLLQSQDVTIRHEALAAAPTFISKQELDSLLPFQHDTLAGETGGMGGPRRYVVRDLALEIAERIAGRTFENGDCFELRDGSKVWWRSWGRFTQWLESRSGGFWRRLFHRRRASLQDEKL